MGYSQGAILTGMEAHRATMDLSVNSKLNILVRPSKKYALI